MIDKNIYIIIFYVLIYAFLKINKQKSMLFVVAFSILNFFVLQNPYINSYGDRYSISVVVSFVAGILFNIKELFIFNIATIFGQIVGKHNIYINTAPDIITNIFSVLLGYYVGKYLYKKNKINPLTAILYGPIISSFYSIVSLIHLSIYLHDGSIVKFDLNYYFLVFVLVIVLFIALFIIYIFGDKDTDEKNSLLHIFIRRFRILLIVLFFAIVFFNNRLFNFYITNKYFDVINTNYIRAISAINKIEEEYGENSLKRDKNAIIYTSEWYTEVGGAVYFLDEDFNLLNEFSDLFKDNNSMQNITSDGFKDIVKYDDNTIFKYYNNNNELYVKYCKYKNYYIVVFVSTEEIVNNISVISYLTSYAIIAAMLAVFLLVYYSIKKNVVNRIQKTNDKLNEISKGDYSIVFDDKSSNEMLQLSNHINSTVKALKNTIKKVIEKNKQELELAKKIQESQLRTDNIEHIAFDINARNIPAEEVGGDFYDYFYIDYRHVMFLIADVSGKGIPGAMFMIKAKNAIINFSKQKLPLDEIVKRTNKSMYQNNDAMMFVTSFIGILDLRTGLLKYINCGHNAPIICRKKNDTYDISYLKTTQQKILGIDKYSEYKVEDIILQEGDKITLYTDGVTEARNTKKEFYGENRLLELYKDVCHDNPKTINEKIISSVKEFFKYNVQFDDITILTLLYTNTKNEIMLDGTDKDINIGKEFLNKFIKLYDMPIDIERNLKVVYDEIYSNIKNHAYNNKGGEIIFRVNLRNKDTIEMVFSDKGPEFNPVNHKSEKTEKNVEDKFDGGMGLIFCRNIMDEIKYERVDNYNVLYLYKKFI